MLGDLHRMQIVKSQGSQALEKLLVVMVNDLKQQTGRISKWDRQIASFQISNIIAFCFIIKSFDLIL